MKLCFDATRFGTGLDGAIELAAAKGVAAIEYSFAPFPASSKAKNQLDQVEKKFLKTVSEAGKRADIEIACLNLDYCFLPGESNGGKKFAPMLVKLAQVARAVHCQKISVSIMPGHEPGWLEAAERDLNLAQDQLKQNDVGLIVRLSTPAQYRGISLKSWTAMQPQDWRDLVCACPGIGLSFSPADCVWLGIDYLRILPGIAAAVEHIEAHDIEINRNLLNDSGLYGPLWWRYRLPGKGQVDWTQLIEALKLYDFNGPFSIHLDDEYVVADWQSLEDALDLSLKHLAPIVSG
jgi:sugar phosphate isomerase/epimerase